MPTVARLAVSTVVTALLLASILYAPRSADASPRPFTGCRLIVFTEGGFVCLLGARPVNPMIYR